jgi:Cd2+/Zn2+-exporting ATPase/Cu+-exporting ATPase
MVTQHQNLITYECPLSGLDCPSCSDKIQRALKAVEGVKEAEVHLGTQKIRVTYDGQKTSINTIKKTLKKLGHEPLEEHQHKEKTRLPRHFFEFTRMGITLVLIALSWFKLDYRLYPLPWAALLALLIAGYPLARRSYFTLRAKVIDADVFMFMGVAAAAVIGEYLSAAVIAFFMLIAEFLEEFTSERARRAIRELIETAPPQARVRRDNQEIEVPVEAVLLGETVVVRSGERIPADGTVTWGRASVNQAPITGESLPLDKEEGHRVYAGTINLNGLLHIKVERVGADTTISRIIRLVEEAQAHKAPIQRIADKFAAWFTPAIMGIAFLTYLISGQLVYAITVVVIACPCTVALATPLAVVAAIGKGSRRGILFKGGAYLELLGKVDTVVLDKTGTLTLGQPQVTEILNFDSHNRREILMLAALAERHSEHPLAKAILRRAEEEGITIPEPDRYRVIPGQGVIAHRQTEDIVLGTAKFLQHQDIVLKAEVCTLVNRKEEEGHTALWLAHNGEFCGVILVADVLRERSRKAVKELRRMGISRVLMLTGDNAPTANAVAAQLGLEEVYAQMMPEDKVGKIQELIAQGRIVAMVGDGINDAPALAQAHVGIAMGALAAQAAIEAADVALMTEDISHLPEAIRLGRKTFGTIRQNLTVGIIFNVVGVTLAAFGLISPMGAAVAHVLPDVLVFINSARLLR